MQDSIRSPLLTSLLTGQWPELGPKLVLQLTIFVGLLVLGALNHFIIQPNARSRQNEGHSADHQSEKERAEEEEIATVEGIYVYPIKSCAGSRLASAQLLKKGFELDRNWAVVRLDTHAVLSLRPEPRLTLIQPEIDEARGLLTVYLSPRAGKDLKPFSIPLRPDVEPLKSWELLPELPLYGDAADGRIVEAVDAHIGDMTPAQWMTAFLGYPAALVQFDTSPSSAVRNSFPIYMGPRPGADSHTLQGPRGIRFADEYPLLVATVESLQALENKIADEVAFPEHETTGTNPISGLRADH